MMQLQTNLEEDRKIGLYEIFGFYSRQHIPKNKGFEEVEELMNQVDLGEFMIFCKDFQVPLAKPKLSEVYKKASDSHKPHKFENFLAAIDKIGFEMNKTKVDDAKERLAQIDKAIKEEAKNRKKKEKKGDYSQADMVPGEEKEEDIGSWQKVESE